MDSVIDFFDSNFFQTLVTFAVGFIAFFIYQRQKKDTKKAAANSIYLEIQHIEKCLSKVKEAVRAGSLNNLDLSLLREDSWSKYSPLFSSDFDKEEWEVITDFYQNARLLDEAIKLSSKSFGDDISQIRVNKQRILADISKDTLEAQPIDGEEAIRQFQTKVDIFDKLYMSKQEDYAYTPVKYLNDAKKCIEDLDRISITSIGTKFKKIIGVR